MSIDAAPAVEAEPEVDSSSRRPLRVVLVAILAVAALVIAGTAGWLIGGNSGSSAPATPTESSVDAGFARDMATHHTQAVTMAGYVRDNTTNPSVELLAFDIETSQEAQIGEMQGWLDTWGLTRSSDLPAMSWMADHDHLTSDGLMPGMATEAQMTQLESLTGPQMDILFLQLMIHHHQGGLPMEQYALEHASEPYVRNLAQKMITLQTSEIVAMEQLLRQLGGTPLPAPSS
jgi:uncharacterized protein (DUF305 family)